MKKELFDWQKNCIDLWFQNRCRGIVNVATGGGKTILALHAIDLLEKVSPLMEYKQLKVKIVVPKLFLLFQWSNALQNELHVDPKDIGYCYGGSTQITDRKYMIYVVNSARYTLARQIISDFKQNNAVFFIGDECHHYGSEENGKIFDFINYVQENSVHYFSMGLSATPNCKNYTTKLVPALGKEIYRYSIGDAKEILSDFSVITIGVTLTEEEQAAYENFTERLKILTSQLRKNCPWLYKGQDEFFFAQLQTLAKNKKNKKSSELAEQFLFLTYKRKSILYLAEERVRGARLLIKSLPVTSRIILFSERIETIDELYQCLKKS
ncbi:MAG: DEAD/DEAH box helicase family protein [Anaerovorax sp.]